MSSHEITASWDRLFSESRENADTRLCDALRATEGIPEGVDRTALITAHMRAAQGEFASSCLGVAAQRVADSIELLASAIREAADE